ncbi:unnamed protein product, partial [Polarella glacialis]
RSDSRPTGRSGGCFCVGESWRRALGTPQFPDTVNLLIPLTQETPCAEDDRGSAPVDLQDGGYLIALRPHQGVLTDGRRGETSFLPAIAMLGCQGLDHYRGSRVGLAECLVMARSRVCPEEDE